MYIIRILDSYVVICYSGISVIRTYGTKCQGYARAGAWAQLYVLLGAYATYTCRQIHGAESRQSGPPRDWYVVAAALQLVRTAHRVAVLYTVQALGFIYR